MLLSASGRARLAVGILDLGRSWPVPLSDASGCAGDSWLARQVLVSHLSNTDHSILYIFFFHLIRGGGIHELCMTNSFSRYQPRLDRRDKVMEGSGGGGAPGVSLSFSYGC